MTYEIRKSTTKMLECLGPAGEHIWRSKLQGCCGMMPGGQGRGGLAGAWAAIWVEATPPRVNRLKLH